LGAEGVGACTDVPGAKRKAVAGRFAGGCHSSRLRQVPIKMGVFLLHRRGGSPRLYYSPRLTFRGCSVKLLTISCETCDQSWTVATPFSVDEQQAVQSCPC